MSVVVGDEDAEVVVIVVVVKVVVVVLVVVFNVIVGVEDENVDSAIVWAVLSVVLMVVVVTFIVVVVVVVGIEVDGDDAVEEANLDTDVVAVDLVDASKTVENAVTEVDRVAEVVIVLLHTC